MRRAIILFIEAGLAVAAAVWMATRPGRVGIEWQGWRIETSTGFAIAVLVAFAVLAGALFDVVPTLRRMIGRGRERSAQRRREAAYAALTGGMAAIAAGDAGQAARAARRLTKSLDDPALAHLLTAQAAQLRGDEAAARDAFEALAEGDATRFLGERGLIAMALRAGDLEAALGLAREAYRARPRAPWLLDTMAELYGRLGRWADAEAVLEEALKRKLLPRAEATSRLAVVLEARAEAAEAAGDSGPARALAKRAHQLDPRLTPATVRLARLELEARHPRRVRRLIEAVWSQGADGEVAGLAGGPHRDLARLYVEASGGGSANEDANARFRALDSLHALNPASLESGFILAEAAVDAKLWGNAQTQLERLAAAGPSARTVRLQARLASEDEAHEGAAGDANPAAWLDRAAAAGRDPGWICGQCGAHAEAWQPICHSCHRLGRIRWTAPTRADADDPAILGATPETSPGDGEPARLAPGD